jgi:tetratricopeptide (TPR) repeat protein
MMQLKNIALSLLVLLLMPVESVFAQADLKAQQENWITLAASMYDRRDFDGAVTLLKSVIEQAPDNDAAYYYLALSSLGKGEAEAAEAYLRQAVELDGGNFWYRQRLAALYAATSQPELAIDIYEGLLKDFPKKSDLYIKLVELYAAREDFEKALSTLDEIETVFGKSESTAVYRFNFLRGMGRAEEAFKSLEEYNKEYSSPYVLTALADWQISMYNDSTALGYYNEALDIAPDYAPALLGKAETLRMTRKYNDYFTVLEKFVEDPLTPVEGKSDYLTAVIQRTDPKFMRSFLPQMDSVISKTIQAHPSDSTIMGLAGIWYYSTDRRQEAGKWFALNADTYPESVSARASLVEFLMYAEMWDELSREGRKAFDSFPQECAFLEMASVGDFNLGRYEEVLEICDKVLDVAPSDSSKTLRALSTKGDIYHRLGDSKKAYKAYDKALKINPDYVYVLNNYAYYLSEEGRNLKKAYQMSKRTVEADPDNATYLDTFGWILFLQGKALEAKPFFKKAMLYGGKESAVIMDHYAEVLYELKEYDLAFVYWNLARKKNVDGEVPGLDEKIAARKRDMKK